MGSLPISRNFWSRESGFPSVEPLGLIVLKPALSEIAGDVTEPAESASKSPLKLSSEVGLTQHTRNVVFLLKRAAEAAQAAHVGGSNHSDNHSLGTSLVPSRHSSTR